MDNDYFKGKRIAKHILDAMRREPNPEHKSEYDKWVNENHGAKHLVDELGDADKLSRKLDDLQSVDVQKSVEVLLQKIAIHENKLFSIRRKRLIIMSVASLAACAVFLFSVWNYVADFPDIISIERQEARLAESIEPVAATNNAILVLESGETIDLHSTMDGVIANATTKTAVKLDSTTTRIPLNTLITPSGVTYNVRLSDGTKVFLNENSKLVYPVKFVGSQRIVSLEGEAYFDVTTNKDTSFVVTSQNNSEIKVLGTKFNVSNKENSTYTTLVEGSVEVKSGENKVVIKPSEQAVINPNGRGISISEVDTNIYTAWMDGRYVFVDENLSEIMKKLSQWYGIEVEYDNQITPRLKLSGSLRKFKSFKDVVQVMEATGLIEIKVQDETHIKVLCKNKK